MWKIRLVLITTLLAKYGTAELSDMNYTYMLWDNTVLPEVLRNNHIELAKLYMNTSVDPCDDFYEYSCGNWKYADELHAELQNVQSVLNAKIEKALEELIESSEDDDNNEQAFKLFYKSCMNTALISERGNQPVIDFLKTLEGWPMINSKSSDENVDWINLSATLALYGKTYILMAYIDPYVDDTSEDPDAINLKISYSNHNYYQDEFENLTAFIMGEAMSNTILDEIKKFSESFWNASSGYFESGTIFTLEELLIEDPHIDWQRYLSLLLQKPVYPTQKVKAWVTSLKDIGAFLSKTPSRIIANYILYTAMMELVNEFIYLNSLDRPSFTSKQYCITYTKRYLSKSLSKPFVDKYLDERSNDHARQLSEEIRKAFTEFIGNIFWIDETTQEIAKQKLNRIQLKVGYTDKDFENYLDYPHLKSDEYFENSMKILQHETKRFYSMKSADYRDTSRFLEQCDMGAFYIRDDKNRTGNIYVTAAMLQPPLFNKYIPNWSNYGGIGYTLLDSSLAPLEILA